MFRSTSPVAETLGLDAPLITYNGALIRTGPNGETIFHHPMDLDWPRKSFAFSGSGTGTSKATSGTCSTWTRRTTNPGIRQPRLHRPGSPRLRTLCSPGCTHKAPGHRRRRGADPSHAGQREGPFRGSPLRGHFQPALPGHGLPGGEQRKIPGTPRQTPRRLPGGNPCHRRFGERPATLRGRGVPRGHGQRQTIPQRCRRRGDDIQ